MFEIIKIAIGIDDVFPKQGFGLNDSTDQLKFTRILNELFGLKFTLFIIANYSDECSLVNNMEWVDWIKSVPYYELAAHGYYHHTSDNKLDFNIGDEEVNNRFQKMNNVFNKVGLDIRGIKPCGYKATEYAYNLMSGKYEWIADHVNNIDKNVSQKRYFHTSSIYKPEFNNTEYIYLTGHISNGGRNCDGLSEEIFSNIVNFIIKLKKDYTLVPSFISEL